MPCAPSAPTRPCSTPARSRSGAQGRRHSGIAAILRGEPRVLSRRQRAAARAERGTRGSARRPPQGWPYTRKWLIGFKDPSGALIAMANVIFRSPRARHMARGPVHRRHPPHGTGTAQSALSALERWTRDLGARWLRLGVVKGKPARRALLGALWIRRGSRAWVESRWAHADQRRSRDGKAACFPRRSTSI